MEDMKILVSIDTIFDTMLGSVFAVNEQWAPALFEAGYLGRLHNTLSLLNPEIDNEQVIKKYKARDISVLKLSRRTNIVNLLADYISQTKHGDAEHPQALNYKIVINTYPYELTKEEVKELISCLKTILDIDYLKRVHIPVEHVTPKYISESFNRFIIYDFDEWVTLHGRELAETPMPLTTCVVPLCYRKGMEQEKDEENAIKWISAGFSSVLDVEFVRLADMSVCIPKGYNFNEEQSDGNE